MPDEQLTTDSACDRPIERISQDKLGRRFFARKTAEAIARRRGRESYVVGLQGPWGCGKSSIKNMVLETLEEISPQTVVVDFAPWQLRDPDALFSAFFDEIAIAIGQGGDRNQESKNRLAAYGKNLTLGGSTMKALGTLGGVLGVPGARIVELLGEGIGSSAKVALEGADAVGEKNLKQLKDELKESLRNLENSVLVVIDDIDRLNIEEILLIFQLVKANADFPNFTYLLLLQREVVEAGITEKLGEQGRDYVGKIIQLPLDVPPISGAQRRQLFLEGLMDICASWELPLSEGQTRELDLLWNNGLAGLLQYPRDVQRLLNSLEFSGALMRGDSGWEVNLADFTAIEALRVQEPKAYSRLTSLKRLLTQPRPSTLTSRVSAAVASQAVATTPRMEDEQPGKEEMDDLIALFSQERRKAICEVLAFVFPQAYWAFIPNREAQLRTAQPRRELGIRASDLRYFERYFALSIPENQISEADIAQAIAVTGNGAQFTDNLREFLGKDLLWLLLMELKDRVQSIPEENFLVLLASLLDFGEEAPSKVGLGGDSVERDFRGLFEAILQKWAEVSERGNLFIQALNNSIAMRFPVRWIWDEENKSRDNLVPTRNDAWATPSQRAELRNLVIQRINGAAQENRLEMHPQVQMLVRFWAETERENATRWLNSKLRDEPGLRFFLSKFSNISYVIGAGPTFTPNEIRFDPEVLGWITDLAKVKNRIAALDPLGWSPIEKEAMQQFVTLADYLLAQQAPASPIGNSTTTSDSV